MYTLTDMQQVHARIAFKDAMGNPARVDGVPVWETSDPAILTVKNISEDGLEADFVTVGPLSTLVQGKVTADADLGAGVQTIMSTVDFEIVSDMAVAASFELGAPTTRPPA